MSEKLFVYSVIGVGFGLISFFKSFKTYHEKRLIENTPTSRIRSLAMGIVEICGKVVADKANPARGPFSGKHCAYCRWTAEEYKSSGKSSRWVTVRDGNAGSYFFVKDDTGTVLVDPKGANVDIPCDYESETGMGSEPGNRIREFLDRHSISHKGLLFNKKMRFREYTLEEGDGIYILGSAGDNPFVDEATSQENEADIMVQKGSSSFYYISDKSEKEVLSKYSWKVTAGLFGGGALVLACLFYIFYRLGIL